MKYGCVSPTPEMGDMDHSDSESSDASFEIVSAEGIVESQTIPPSFKPCIKFHDIFDVYPVDADVVARISTSEDFKISSDDKVVVVPLAWLSVDQAVCVSKLNGHYVRFDVNELPKTPVDQFYQLCYCTAGGNVVGVSTPFFFREVHEEDLMEFQKEQNKEFWTFRSRFAVLTDLYWNAVKNNGATRLDEMSGSCGAKKDSETTELVESFTANNDAEAVEKSSSGSNSSIQVSVTSEKSNTENCCATEVSEITVESSTENCSANEASETTEKSPAANCSVIKDSESAETVPAENKTEDPVQPPPACVNQEPTIVNEEPIIVNQEPAIVNQEPTIVNQVSENSEKEPKANADSKHPKFVNDQRDQHSKFVNDRWESMRESMKESMKESMRESMRESIRESLRESIALDFGASRRSDDDRGRRFVDIGPWKLHVNDSFYDRNLHSNREPIWWGPRRRRAGDTLVEVGPPIVSLSFFRTLPVSLVGRLIVEAMSDVPVEQLEKDKLLCEARRQTRYSEMMRKHKPVDNESMHATSHPREPAGHVSQTILSLTSRLEAHAVLMRDLKMQLANESKTIDALKGEYLTYKKEMETRLNHCAKKYVKICLKLRQLSIEGRKGA